MVGVEQTHTYSPMDFMESTAFAWSAGINQLNFEQKGEEKRVISIKNGSWFALSSVDFSNNITKFTASVLSECENLVIELRENTTDGILIDSMKVPVTKNHEWTQITMKVENMTGIHDLYVMIKGNNSHEELLLENYSIHSITMKN